MQSESRAGSPSVRPATVDDAPAVQAIYVPVVTGTATSFEIEPPTVDEMADRILRTLAQLPWLVAVSPGGDVTGYAYASPHRGRPAYSWSVETSVYVDAGWRGRRVGASLYGELLRSLSALGYVSAYAGITLPNDASVALHDSCGFAPIGVFPAVGYKAGRWHDVGWWHRRLQDPPARPEPPSAYGATGPG